MTTLKQLTDAMQYDSQKRIIEDLREYYKTDAEMLADLVDDNSEILDKVHEWADGQVSVYTGEVYKWISDHFSEVCRYEEDAIKKTR